MICILADKVFFSFFSSAIPSSKSASSDIAAGLALTLQLGLSFDIAAGLVGLAMQLA